MKEFIFDAIIGLVAVAFIASIVTITWMLAKPGEIKSVEVMIGEKTYSGKMSYGNIVLNDGSTLHIGRDATYSIKVVE